MTVFIVQKPRVGGARGAKPYDLSPAMEFGPLAYIFEGDDHPGLTPGPALRKAQKVLSDFGDDDFLCWAGGDPAGLTIATLAAASVNQDQFQFLRWERYRGGDGHRVPGAGFYTPVTISLRNTGL